METQGLKSYVIRSGRMSAAQKRSYENLYSKFCVPRDIGVINYEELFGNSGPVIIEIGFGSGSATALIAQENPGINYLGIEVYRPGIGRLLWEIENKGIGNIRIMEGDAAEILIHRIPRNEAAGFHIFFPDPWPKKRHHKRRLIRRPFTDLLAACLRQNGYVYMVTDWIDYADWALAELSNTAFLKNQYGGFALPQDWRPRTRFESKGLQKDHDIRELFFIKE